MLELCVLLWIAITLNAPVLIYFAIGLSMVFKVLAWIINLTLIGLGKE